MSKYFGFGIGIGSKNSQGQWLEVFFPQPRINPEAELIEAAQAIGYEGGNQIIELDANNFETFVSAAGELLDADKLAVFKNAARPVVLVMLQTDSESQSTPEAYFKLHLLSHRLVKPHSVNLNGIFALLPNVAWTSQGAIDTEELLHRQLLARAANESLMVYSVDKFPRMCDYVVPAGVRIADTARVRLGAYIGAGTTIMHEGFVNFNAGTLGTSMVEGRISSGVVVGKDSDLGGGCSTMGTLSGGGNIVISVGEGCLIGANAGIGIALGDRCTVESGLYITAGSKVLLIDQNGNEQGSAKARELSGRNDLLFRRNSLTGAIECLSNKSAINLNDELHAHN